MYFFECGLYTGFQGQSELETLPLGNGNGVFSEQSSLVQKSYTRGSKCCGIHQHYLQGAGNTHVIADAAMDSSDKLPQEP